VKIKPTHTGQYQHISSFSPWSRKVAWIRALVHRAYKICNTEDLLKDELQHIKNFLSWNGFPRKLSLKLIDQFKPSTTSNINVIHQDNPDTDLTNPVPKIWLPLPYLGKYGTRLTRSFIHRITPLSLGPVYEFECISFRTDNLNCFRVSWPWRSTW
jgi:hypothetical protein